MNKLKLLFKLSVIFVYLSGGTYFAIASYGRFNMDRAYNGFVSVITNRIERELAECEEDLLNVYHCEISGVSIRTRPTKLKKK